jgi:putrescine aminotransferase
VTRRPSDEALAHASRYLRLLEAPELALEERQALVRETLENCAAHINRGFLTYRKSVTEAGQYAALEWSGQGSTLRDIFDREYIDCLGGYGIFSAGVNHPRVLRAVTAQLGRMALNSQELLEPWRCALARVLASAAPGDLECCFFINNGTDAIEGALKLARLYTGKKGFVAALNGFHGKSLGSLSLMGKAMFREPFWPLLGDVYYVPFGDAKAVEEELRKAEAVGVGIAGVVLEPVQGEAGVIVPSDDYWPAVREICTRHDVLLIADEVQTGMGRTGALFGVDHWDVAPDILCLGKSLGGGVMPLSAFVSTPEIWEVLIPNPIIHSTTFGGNPLACAAGLAAIEVTLAEDLPGQAAAKGAYLMGEMRKLADRYPEVVFEVRGKGLLIGLELQSQEIGWKTAAGLFKRGVLVAGTYARAKTLRFEPALGIPRETLDEVLGRLEDTFREIAGGMRAPAEASPERARA